MWFARLIAWCSSPTEVVMMRTTRILDDILEREGWPTYTEPSAAYPDRGGPTKGGITLTALRMYRHAPNTPPRALQELKREEAMGLLRSRYVQCNGIETLERADVFAQVVDNSVLSGPYQSARDLQRAVGVTADGIVGPQTRAAVEAQGDRVGHALVAVRALRIAAFVQANPKQLIFLKGWMRRVLSFLEEV